MRCKKHYTDLSSTVGVCACCLRERLSSLVTAEEQALAQIQNVVGKHRSLENNKAFPPVSPYINGRKSDHHPYPSSAPRQHHSVSDHRFYRRPTVDHNTGGHSNKKKSFIRVFSFPNIFRSRNRNSVDPVSDPRASDSTVRESYGGGKATSSASWFSRIIYGGHHKKKQTVCVDESTATVACDEVRRQQYEERGISPVRHEDELYNTTSGYESTESWKNTPRRKPAHPHVRRGSGGGHVRNLSFYLSPLVRASPNRQWNQKGLPADVMLPGETRTPVKPHLGNIKSFCANKSRKLADFGRPNANR